MNKEKAGYIEGIVSVFVNTVLFAAKLWAGIITGSIALTADAWHTLSDSLSSIIVIISIKLSSKKADKEHPFGHGRWEQISALFIGFLLAIIAYDFLKDSIIQFNKKEAAQFGTIAIIVTIISIIAKEALAQYAFYIGRETNNVTIKADGWHHRSDALSSVAVLIGIFLAPKFWWMDSLLGLIISLMLFYAAFEIIKEAIGKLLGEMPDKKLINKIETEIKNLYSDEDSSLSDNPAKYISTLHHYHIHNYVSHQELTFHIKLDDNLSIARGHKIATEIENRIFKVFGIIATIHIEPINFEHKFD